VNCFARLLVLPVVVLSPSLARSQQSVQIDPVVVSPNRFKILVENEHVRVVEYTLRPGERDQWHTHPPKVSYVVSGGELRIHLADGTSFPSDEKEGSAVWMNALPRHYAENVGNTPVRIVLIEVKSADDRSKPVRANTR
jgi:quercetin dioxygenase-like cupin family protein